PVSSTGRKVNATTNPKTKTGQRNDRIRPLLGRTNAMMPGRKHGTKRSSDARLSQPTCGCVHAPPRDKTHNPSNGQKARPRRTQTNRNGRNTYICSSKGSDHNTLTIDFTCTRFCTSSTCERIDFHPGNVP